MGVFMTINNKIEIPSLCGSMAQLVEQMTVNHWVTGSSPVTPAIKVLIVLSL